MKLNNRRTNRTARRTFLKGIATSAIAIGGFSTISAGHPGKGNLVRKIANHGFYTSTVGEWFEFRSKNPMHRELDDVGTVHHFPHRGGVRLVINQPTSGDTEAEDVGLYLPVGNLQDIDEISIPHEQPSDIAVNLWFDLDEDGEFFEWVKEKDGRTARGNDAIKVTGGPDEKVLGGPLDGDVDLVSSGHEFAGDLVTSDRWSTIREIQDGFSSQNTLPQDPQTAVWLGIWDPVGSVDQFVEDVVVETQ